MIEVAAVRERLGLTQAELASVLEVAGGTVARWEAGNAGPRGPARVLLEALDVSGLDAATFRALRTGRLWGAPFRLWAVVFDAADRKRREN